MKRLLLLVVLTLPLMAFTAEQGTVPDSLVLKLQRATGDDYQRARVLEDIISYYIDRDELNYAKPYIDEIEHLSEILRDDYLKTLNCYYTILYLNKENDLQATVPYLYEARLLLEKLDDNDQCNRLRMRVYNVLALFYYSYDMLPQAYESLNLCFRINEKLNSSNIDFNLNRHLMMLYLSMHKYQESLALGKKLSGFKAKDTDMFYYYLEMLDAYAACKMIDSALCYADSAFLYDSSGKHNWLVNDRKGTALLDFGRYDEAYDCFDKMFRDIGNDHVSREDSLYIDYRCHWSRAMYYNNLNQFDSALWHVDRSLAGVSEFVSLTDECNIMTLKTDILRRAGNYEEALENMEANQRLNDSLIKQKNVQNVESLMFQQQMKEYEAEQQYQNHLRETKQRIRLVVLAFITTLLLSGVVILLLMIKKRKLEAMVTEEELELRNRELTEAAVVMMKKNEAYSEVIVQLRDIKDNTDDKNAQKAIDRVSRKIEQTMDDGYYGEFSVRFKQVHPDFIEKLTKKHPDLSPNEIKICSFLKLNMSTKEIAALTGQSVAAIEMARYRIRRKLGISTDDHRHLSNYLLRI